MITKSISSEAEDREPYESLAIGPLNPKLGSDINPRLWAFEIVMSVGVNLAHYTTDAIMRVFTIYPFYSEMAPLHDQHCRQSYSIPTSEQYACLTSVI